MLQGNEGSIQVDSHSKLQVKLLQLSVSSEIWLSSKAGAKSSSTLMGNHMPQIQKLTRLAQGRPKSWSVLASEESQQC